MSRKSFIYHIPLLKYTEETFDTNIKQVVVHNY